MHAGVMMTATPPQALLKAALDAGLLNLQHKALNATSVRPVHLELDVLRLVRAREHSADVAKLLNCAQRCYCFIPVLVFVQCCLVYRQQRRFCQLRNQIVSCPSFCFSPVGFNL